MSTETKDEDTIHEAAERCDLDAVRLFVEVEGVNVDCLNEYGITPLISAILGTEDRQLRVPTVSYLISKKADVEAKLPSAHYYRESTALTLATDHPSSLCVVPILLQHGADVNPTEQSPLANACMYKGAANVVQKLLERRANVEAKEDGQTPIQTAAKHSDGATVRLLIAHGAKVNAPRDAITKTPLWIAVSRGNISALQALLENGAKVSFVDRSVLHNQNLNAETCGILLDHCRSTMTEDEVENLLLHPCGGQIPLQYIKTAEVAKLLVEQPRRQDKQLLPVCHAQLVWKTTSMESARSSDDREGLSSYLAAFKSLALSVPEGERMTAKRRKLSDSISIRLNPALSDFQRSVGEEALQLIMDSTDSPDSISYAILGYLSALDVMKRTDAAA